MGNWTTFHKAEDEELTQGRTHNNANEITAIQEYPGEPSWADPAYDARGNISIKPRALVLISMEGRGLNSRPRGHTFHPKCKLFDHSYTFSICASQVQAESNDIKLEFFWEKIDHFCEKPGRCKNRCSILPHRFALTRKERVTKAESSLFVGLGKKTQPPAIARGCIDYPQGESNPCLQDENLIS